MAEPLRRFGAVVFDLFGTLVHEFPKADWDAWFAGAAAALDADPIAFRRVWETTSVERQTGRLGDMAASVLEVSRRAGAPPPSPDRIARAMELRMELYERWFRPMPGAEDTLAFVRAEGLPSALVSMCAPDTPPLWRASSLASFIDLEVFSSEVGLRKPDPAIYRYAADGLGVEAASASTSATAATASSRGRPRPACTRCSSWIQRSTRRSSTVPRSRIGTARESPVSTSSSPCCAGSGDPAARATCAPAAPGRQPLASRIGRPRAPRR